MIPKIVYILCGATSIFCAGLLFRQFWLTRATLLFWSTLCFICLAITNILLFVDLVVLPTIDLSPLRSGVTLAGMMMLLYGLIRERSR